MQRILCKGEGIYEENCNFVSCQVNNFQAVLVKNGRHSFAIFNHNQIGRTTDIDSESRRTEEGLCGAPAQVSV